MFDSHLMLGSSIVIVTEELICCTASASDVARVWVWSWIVSEFASH